MRRVKHKNGSRATTFRNPARKSRPRPHQNSALGSERFPHWNAVNDPFSVASATGYNAEYSDRPFAEKRDMKGGFRESPLLVSQGLRELDTWDEQAIMARAERLAVRAADVWRPPSLPDEVLDTYRPKTEKPARYTIADQAWLGEGSPMRALFETFRKEVLALDPCVDEEFLKFYVAYKAETNFVDVVPLKARLRLALNMAFHEVHDPRGECKDVSNKGRWGNGDVEVALKSLDEMPYVMGLVRQAFELQMGNGEADA